MWGNASDKEEEGNWGKGEWGGYVQVQLEEGGADADDACMLLLLRYSGM